MEQEHRPIAHSKKPPLNGTKSLAMPEIWTTGLMPNVRQGQEIENQADKGDTSQNDCDKTYAPQSNPLVHNGLLFCSILRVVISNTHP